MLLPALILGFFAGLLLFAAAFTLVERKLMALLQRREGPDKVGIEGLGQPFADGLKLLRKETLHPKDSPEQRLFYAAPLLSLWVALLLWSLVPFGSNSVLVAPEMGLLLLLGLSSLGSYGVIYAGWASNSKYALLGAFRAVAQFISYELLLSLLFLPLLGFGASANLQALVEQQRQFGWFSYLLPLMLLALMVVLAETNRTPFDLPEAEAELVAGYNVEYSSLPFAFFFLAEYVAMGFFGALISSLFLGGFGGNPFGRISEEKISENILGLMGENAVELMLLGFKIQVMATIFVAIRAALPRLRFDQLLLICWKQGFGLALGLALLPLGLSYGGLAYFPLLLF